MKVSLVVKGGDGSGHYGHAGRPGKHGGSLPGKRGDHTFIPGSAPWKDVTYPEDTTHDVVAMDFLYDGLSDANHYYRSLGDEELLHEASDQLRSEVKDEIVKTVSKTSGMKRDDVNDAMALWAESSNGNPAAMMFQDAASKEFGIRLSEWQQERIQEHKADGLWDFDTGTQADARTYLRTVYENTQQQFADRGLRPEHTLTLYRGIRLEDDDGYDLGDVINYQGNAMESWSSDRATASEFGNRFLAMEVPVKNVLSTCRTGFGCLTEYEFVVVGSVPGTQARVVIGERR